MSFCPKCGRQRGTSALFCGGCGHAFGQPAAAGAANDAADDATVGAADPVLREAAAAPAVAPLAADATRADPVPAAEPAASEPAEQSRWDAPAGQTRMDTPVWPTRLDVPREGERPAGYPSWYAEETPDTITARPGNDAGFPPPAPPGYPPPPAPPEPGRRPGNRRTAAFVIAVVLVALAAGGGAYALAGSHRHPTAQPPASPTVSAPPGTTSPTAQAPTSPALNASGSPTASPSPSATPSPTRPAGVQTAAGAASDPAAPQVVAYLNRYFSAINTHNYGAYQSLLDAQEQAGNSQSQFDSGYASTKDSNEVLTSIEETGGGTLTADVSFTSHQHPADSADGHACNNWQISLFLTPSGSSYVMTAAPAGYHAGYTDC